MSHQAAVKPEHSKKRGCLLILLTALFLLVAVPSGLLAIWSRNVGQRVEQQLAELRAAGAPTSYAELETFYRLPPGAADTMRLWLRAIEPLQTDQFAEDCRSVPVLDVVAASDDEPSSDDFSSEEAPPPEPPNELAPPGQEWIYRERCERLLNKYDESMSLIQAATDKGGYARFNTDFQGDFVSATLDLINPLRTAARMLTLQAYVRAHQGDLAGTTQTLQSALRMRRLFEQNVTLVTQLVGYAVSAMASSNIIELVPHLDFDDEQLATLQNELRATDGLANLRRALQGERAWGIELIRRPHTPDLPFFRNDNLELYLKILGEIEESAAEGWPALFATCDRLEDELAVVLNGLNRFRYGIGASAVVGVESVALAAARDEVHRAMVDARIAIKRFRLATGNIPEQLEQLVPDYLPQVPIDVFVNKPVQYEVVQGGFCIWSVGDDRINDGGDRAHDIVVTSGDTTY